MPIRRVTPKEASDLVAEGWTYIDVRTIPEFEAEHPAGAYNVPLMHQGPSGRTANADFVEIVEGAFGRGEKLLVACAGGTRSRRAAEMLADAGFENVIDVRGGFAGETDSMGRVVTPGWKPSGLPTATGGEPGRSYEDVMNRARGGND